MRSSWTAASSSAAVLTCSAFLFVACANSQGGSTGSGGGGNEEGGSTGMGGESNGSGGSGSGGVTASGGATGFGGVTGTGGIATGGVTGSGGTKASGGTTGSAGAPASGGTTGLAGTIGGGGAATGGVTGIGGSGTSTGGSGSGTCGGGSATSGDVTVTLSSLQQKISGFGASTAWGNGFSNASDPDTLWSTTTGAGLSLHRIRIAQDGTTSETSVAQKAVTYGVKVWSAIWASNTSGQAEATMLKTFAATMKTAGVPLYAMSAGNEPDSNANGSVYYSASSMATWVGNYFGPTLSSTALLIAPETENWCTFPSYLTALENNATAWSYVNIVATHEYGCNPSAYPAIAQAGKEFWETEIYDTSTTADPGMGSGLRIAALIHNAMTVANMNAWHYWWVYGTVNQCLYCTDSKKWTKRLWVEGNYARFIRPGYQRVGTTGTGPSNVLSSAYINPADGTVVIVAINNSTSATPISFYVSGATPCSVTPWVTDANNNLASTTAISVSNGRFSAMLGAQSVTTFVGKP
jgi:glucuronoarabinoxylan endo-1,4-beta-xylanase